MVGAAAPGMVRARIAQPALTRRGGFPVATRPRIRVRWKLPGQIQIGMGQACDPRSASCPPEARSSAVRLDVPAEWLTTFTRPTGEEINEASAEQSTWDTFMQAYTARAGMAFARLRATLTNYMTLAVQQQRAISQTLRDNPNASPDARMKAYSAIQAYTWAIVQVAGPLAWLNAVAAGQAVIGFDLLGWQFAYVPMSELPADAPTPISIAPEGVGVAPVVIIVIVSIVAMFVAGATAAWWAGARAQAEPAIQRANGERALAEAQARGHDFQTQLAKELADAGHPDAAAAIVAMAQRNFGFDLRALNEGNWAEASAARAAAESGWGGIGEIMKWGLLGLFALKAMEHLKA